MLQSVNEKQNIASNPEYSIWTSASAGSGKTTVLTKRLLRMFLAGIEPSKILCITFTNTGAIQMRNKINEKLAKWAVLDDNSLEKEIFGLEGTAENIREKLKIARTLFAKILDCSNDFKILTIHSFCQQIIKRFPLEANVIPNFQVADEILSNELLLKAKDELLKVQDETVKKAMEFVFTYKNEDDFMELLRQAINQKDNLLYLKKKFFSVDGVVDKIRKIFNVSAKSMDEIKNDFLKNVNLNNFSREILEVLKDSGKKTNAELADKIVSLKNNFNIDLYFSIFLTQSNTIRSRLITKEIAEKYADFMDYLSVEAQRVFDYRQRMIDFVNFELTSCFLRIVYSLLDIYSRLKKESGYLDYSDLILETNSLLGSSRYRNINEENIYSSWINFKLDEGIDHLLIDEAQDTSPIQWEIVKSITDEFFSGYGQKGSENRTIFVVGDEKQSIFSFQGAEPKNFDLMLNYYRDRVKNAGKRFENIYLETSFRSLKSILSITDMVFDDGARASSISRADTKIKHNVFRNDGVGRVVLFPLVGKDANAEETEEKSGKWKINYLDEIELTNKQILAHSIVDEIDSWFKKGKVIQDRDLGERAIRYSDIMILVRNRDKDFINYLIMQFNKKNIPTMGNDRFEINSNIIAQDIISLLKFLIFNRDDLSLANIIKSPFFNMTEDDLFNLCQYKNNNGCSLFEAFKTLNINNSKDFLLDILDKSKNMSVYELLHYIFEIKNMRKSFKEHFLYTADEVINEFLKIANEYEKSHNNSTILNFIDFIETSNLIIKRDIEQSSNEIKIITVHSSKGLESPIVILPDTNHTNTTIKKIDKILNFKKGPEYNIPLLQMEESDFTSAIREYMKNEVEDEYLRLLYVAMTRAKNELYICDCKRKGEVKENSWYGIIESVLKNNNAKTEYNENFKGNMLYIGDEDKFNRQLMEKDIDKQNTDDVDKILKTIGTKNKKKLNNEIKIINPSLYYSENLLKNPYQKSTSIENGKIVHKLLEILPETNKNEWEKIMDFYLKSNNEADKIKQIVLNILNNDKFSFLFGKDSRAEVSIFGKVSSNEIISGKIDRMAIIGDKIYLVDYKNTNTIPKTVPDKYIKQLADYKRVLQKIYADKIIECYILWTSFGEMIKLNI